MGGFQSQVTFLQILGRTGADVRHMVVQRSLGNMSERGFLR